MLRLFSIIGAIFKFMWFEVLLEVWEVWKEQAQTFRIKKTKS